MEEEKKQQQQEEEKKQQNEVRIPHGVRFLIFQYLCRIQPLILKKDTVEYLCDLGLYKKIAKHYSCVGTVISCKILTPDFKMNNIIYTNVIDDLTGVLSENVLPIKVYRPHEEDCM